VKTGQDWRAAGRKLSGERGVERKVKVRYNKGRPYIKLANVDLVLLGLIQREYW